MARVRRIPHHWRPVSSVGQLAGDPGRRHGARTAQHYHVSRTVQISLTPQQETDLAPLVREASQRRQNILLLATAVPRDGTWQLQVVNVPATLGPKLRRLLNKEGCV
jgi:hypothetical protein